MHNTDMSAQALKEVLEAQLASYKKQSDKVNELLDEGWVFVGLNGDKAKLEDRDNGIVEVDKEGIVHY